jgi:hypothetical protein
MRRKWLDSPLCKNVLDAQVSHTAPERFPEQGPKPQVASVPEGRKAAQQPLVSIIQRWVNNINIYRVADSIRHMNIPAFRPIFVLSLLCLWSQ